MEDLLYDVGKRRDYVFRMSSFLEILERKLVKAALYQAKKNGVSTLNMHDLEGVDAPLVINSDGLNVFYFEEEILNIGEILELAKDRAPELYSVYQRLLKKHTSKLEELEVLEKKL